MVDTSTSMRQPLPLSRAYASPAWTTVPMVQKPARAFRKINDIYITYTTAAGDCKLLTKIARCTAMLLSLRRLSAGGNANCYCRQVAVTVIYALTFNGNCKEPSLPCWCEL